MSSIPDNDHEQLTLIAVLFKEAEDAIKEIEDIGSELVIPAVNQLRYCGNHLARYLSNTDNKEELQDAAKHCKRATYDAYEAAITYQLLEFHKFKDDYRMIQVGTIIPDYADIRQQIEQARKFIRGNNESNTRGEFYQEGRTHLQTLSDKVEKLNANRDDLNRLITSAQRTFIFRIIGGIAAVVAISSFIINL